MNESIVQRNGRGSGSISLRARRRNGMTLIELVVAMAILGTLAALLLAAIVGVKGQGIDVQRQVEIRKISDALEKFKAAHGTGVYPPSRIYLFEDMDYSPPVAQGGTFPFLAGSPEDELRLRSIKYLNAIWPGLRMLKLAGDPPVPPMDWNGDGLTDAKMELFGDQCLVFFLGGIPNSVQTGPSSGQAIQLKGFLETADTPAPLETTGATANPWLKNKTVKYCNDFQPGRLAWKDTIAFGGTTMRPMPVYINAAGENNVANAIFYFSSYEKNGYQPEDGGPDAGGQPAETDTVAIKYARAGAVLTPTKKGPNPYIADVDTYTYGPSNDGNNPPNPLLAKFLKPDTYQLIDPGVDGFYGVGGQLPVIIGSGTSDNMTNFTGRPLGTVKETRDPATNKVSLDL